MSYLLIFICISMPNCIQNMKFIFIKSKLLTVLIVVWFNVIPSISTLYAWQDYRVESITVADGLLQNQVESIIQDSLGFIWMG